jgi:hypothetical protein
VESDRPFATAGRADQLNDRGGHPFRISG